MIKAVIFDFGGVMHANTEEDVYRCIADAFGMEAETLKKEMRKDLVELEKGKISEAGFWQSFCSKIGKPIPKNAGELWIREYSRRFADNKTVIGIVESLKQNHYQVICLSNTVPAHANYNKKHKKYDIFDKVILSTEVGMVKPGREIYEYAAKEAGCLPDECAFVDDKERNTIPAEIAGLKAIVFRDASHLEEDLKKLGVEF